MSILGEPEFNWDAPCYPMIMKDGLCADIDFTANKEKDDNKVVSHKHGWIEQRW